MTTTFEIERSYSLADHNNLIVGIDEAGCGPWAGPVVAACVAFHQNQYDMIEQQGILNDSKKLSPIKRQRAYHWIKEHAFYGVGAASVKEIDTLNIAGATMLAMRRAFQKLEKRVLLKFGTSTEPMEHKIIAALVDGIRNPKLSIATQMIVEGDGKSCSIAAASILAKVTRDRLMMLLGKRYPMYGFERNAGYGTKLHQEGLRDHGITFHHRLSYAPIKKLLEQSAA